MVEHASNSEKFRQGLWPLLLALTILTLSGSSKVAAPGIVGIDKLAHFAVFGLLATTLARNDRIRRWPWLGMAWAVVLTSAFGAGDEWRQSFTPGRSVELTDWIADTLGAVTAVVLYARWKWYRQLLETPVKRRSAGLKSAGVG